MQTFDYTIKDEIGIHARPAGILAKEARGLGSTVSIVKDGKKADVTRIMAVMALQVKCGETVTVEVEGPDEVEAVAKVKEFFENNL